MALVSITLIRFVWCFYDPPNLPIKNTKTYLEKILYPRRYNNFRYLEMHNFAAISELLKSKNLCK